MGGTIMLKDTTHILHLYLSMFHKSLPIENICGVPTKSVSVQTVGLLFNRYCYDEVKEGGVDGKVGVRYT
jgi:hypothetical protein